MDARYATLCFLLVLVLHGDPTLADTCWDFTKVHPFCFNPLCKANCYLEGKSQDGAYVGRSKCDGHGIWSLCNCVLCRH
ncbi:hypothetical protein BAE44_0021110 [Dichanthelium oligosanthes]|uniref:Knottin scorpion toxin-like domain-containing protein n=1 Tax=Dichanthelium oligosanthes TaxID=888268 RepID=A0A1E5UYD1_9POAL|nr:hypothetical protein BAE44_0021110 [Dichanthelium oligosanthes]